MSVLAHVVLGGALPGEPAATKALAFILNSSPDIARAFIGLIRGTNVEFEPGRIKAELEHEGSRPDLTIYDSDGHVRVFVENKFWAGLTEAQPVSYLRDLPNDPPSALVFVVPDLRVSAVWNELKIRCSQAELEWVDGSSDHTATWGPRRDHEHTDHELEARDGRLAGRCPFWGARQHQLRHQSAARTNEPDGFGSVLTTPPR